MHLKSYGLFLWFSIVESEIDFVHSISTFKEDKLLSAVIRSGQ